MKNKTTIRDYLEECEKKDLGILYSITGKRIDPMSVLLKFLGDSGFWERQDVLDNIRLARRENKDKNVKMVKLSTLIKEHCWEHFRKEYPQFSKD
ncbi:MAG TPA: hypothetical protein PLZ70_00520 [Candidatus Paceibacterota bacterium]|jgi:hypothetical protein|nr:hypothetical protein [Candidatus Paceibacterota bacterium]HQM18717.1 hypothetical protein [Candidatus Paceibacterota bacterium]HQQ21884.1 hypothetical protein [Candidatus Paceibacterota bacterium]